LLFGPSSHHLSWSCLHLFVFSLICVGGF